MRLHDTRRSSILDVVPARPGVLTVRSSVVVDGGGGSLGDLRTPLVADLIRRTASLRGVRALVIDDAEGPSDDRAALNIHPAELLGRGGEGAGLTVDIAVGLVEGLAPTGHHVAVGTVRAEGNEPETAPVSVAAVRERGMDPLALRLVLLATRYREPVSVTWTALTAADAELHRWRDLVARWASGPSAAMPAAAMARIVDALEDDLDTPLTLTLLRGLGATSDVSDGAKFESFAYLDRVLGLDLVRDVGRASAS